MKKLLCLLLALLLVASLCACGKKDAEPTVTTQAPTQPDACIHNWKEATCVTPKTCTVCQATQGETAEHTWKDATCIAPKTCTVCQATEGEVENHFYFGGACAICGRANPSYKVLTEGAWFRRMENGQIELFIFGEGREMFVWTNEEIGSTGKALYTVEEFKEIVQQYKASLGENWAQPFAQCMVWEIGGIQYVTGKVSKTQADYLVEGDIVLVAYQETIETYERVDGQTLHFQDKEYGWAAFREVDSVASFFK
ncbi:MAG: hypothetical protein J6Q30_03145 [Oscillospiraceae bacterium]|nr:hypothetical protein [Oscillospiraceae bacterium]